MDVKVIRSDRRTASVEISRDLTVTVRVPRRFSDERVQAFVERSSGWIEKHLQAQRERNARLRFPVDADRSEEHTSELQSPQ